MLVFVGGCVGTAIRLGVLEFGWSAPWATLAVNLAGATALGWLVSRRYRSEVVMLGVGIGVLGSLTTFSTLIAEAVELGWGLGSIYVAASAVIGVAMATVAMRAARRT